MIALLLPLVVCAADVATTNLDFRQPQLASQGRNVAMVFGAGNDVYFSASSNHGNDFSVPLRVASTPSLSLGNHRGPRIAYTADAIVITAPVGPAPAAGAAPGGHGAHGAPHALLSWRSSDGGKTWIAGPRVSANAGEGFHSLGSDGKNRLWEAWLQPVEGRVKLMGAHSEDAGATWSEPALIYQSPDGNVCECCHPSIAFSADGEVLVMFRNSLGGARDFYVARSKDAKAWQVSKIGEGTWPLKACPMDGGGIAISGANVTTAWRRNLDIFVAKPGEAEKKIGEGRNPAVAIGKNGTYVIWSAPQGLMAMVPGKSEPYVLATSGGFATISSSGMQVVAAWEDGGRIKTARLD